MIISIDLYENAHSLLLLFIISVIAYVVSVSLLAKKLGSRAAEQLAERTLLAELTADVGYSLTRQETIHTMLQECVDAVVNHLGVAFARVWVINEDQTELELKASAGIYTHLDGEHSRIVVGESKIGRIAKTGAPHITNCVIGDPQVHDQDWAKREGMVSFAGLPLIAGGKMIGVVALFSRRELSGASLKALYAITDEIAVGISRLNAIEILREMSLQDELTGLANRRRFDEVLENEWSRARRNEYSVSLIIMDIDHFKLFNDRYGHEEGNKCLKRIVSTISKALKRATDFAARYGGEEIVVILPNSDQQSAYALADSIRKDVGNLNIPYIDSGVKGCEFVTISSGVATIEPGKECEPEALVTLAEGALCKARKNGRNQVSSVEAIS